MTAMDAGTVLQVFAKAPVAGQVKTRLAVDIGEHAALQVHVQLVEAALERLGSCQMRKELWLSAPHRVSQGWSNLLGAQTFIQQGADLGHRMYHSLCAAVSEPNVSKVILVGTDCPDIDAAYVEQADARLRDHLTVFGPAEDGGYGLVGVQTQHVHRVESAFKNMTWGHAQVLSETCARLKQGNVSFDMLAPIWDVDRLADWERYQQLGRD